MPCGAAGGAEGTGAGASRNKQEQEQQQQQEQEEQEQEQQQEQQEEQEQEQEQQKRGASPDFEVSPILPQGRRKPYRKGVVNAAPCWPQGGAL